MNNKVGLGLACVVVVGSALFGAHSYGRTLKKVYDGSLFGEDVGRVEVGTSVEWDFGFWKSDPSDNEIYIDFKNGRRVGIVDRKPHYVGGFEDPISFGRFPQGYDAKYFIDRLGEVCDERDRL